MSRAQQLAGAGAQLAAEAAGSLARVVPTWRSKMAKSLQKNKRLAYSRYVQLATVRRDGRPANRTGVYCGLLGVWAACPARSLWLQSLPSVPSPAVLRLLLWATLFLAAVPRSQSMLACSSQFFQALRARH
jgi:hypothetical protein